MIANQDEPEHPLSAPIRATVVGCFEGFETLEYGPRVNAQPICC
jgi:hypothetical protein